MTWEPAQHCPMPAMLNARVRMGSMQSPHTYRSTRQHLFTAIWALKSIPLRGHQAQSEDLLASSELIVTPDMLPCKCAVVTHDHMI